MQNHNATEVNVPSVFTNIKTHFLFMNEKTLGTLVHTWFLYIVPIVILQEGHGKCS